MTGLPHGSRYTYLRGLNDLSRAHTFSADMLDTGQLGCHGDVVSSASVAGERLLMPSDETRGINMQQSRYPIIPRKPPQNFVLRIAHRLILRCKWTAVRDNGVDA